MARPSAQIPMPEYPAPSSPLVLVRHADGRVERDVAVSAIPERLADGEAVAWADLDMSDPAQAAVLGEVFRFHPLAIEDATNPKSRVKVDEYPNFLIVIARVVSFCETTEDPYDLDTANLSIFVTKNLVVTCHLQRLPIVETLVTTIDSHPDMLGRGPSRIAHFLLDGAVDAYFPVLDQLDEFVDDLEQRVFGKFDEELLEEIFKVKRLVITLRRYLAPQREVLSELTMRPSAFLPMESQLYFRDVYDHMLRITDALDSYRDLLSSTLDSYLTQVSNRLGSVSKGLAVVGALSVPFVVIAGVYGMNFDHIPLAHHPYGFEILFGLQLALGFLLMLWLKKSKWL